jgi:hypothetical protein
VSEQRGKVIDLYHAAARLAFSHSALELINGRSPAARAMAFLANENLLRRGYPATIKVINMRMGNVK